jgi:Yos1-like
MGFSLGSLFISVVLLLNAGAILNEERFLKKCTLLSMEIYFFQADGWHRNSGARNEFGDPGEPKESFKTQMIELLYFTRRYGRCKSQLISLDFGHRHLDSHKWPGNFLPYFNGLTHNQLEDRVNDGRLGNKQ